MKTTITILTALVLSGCAGTLVDKAKEIGRSANTEAAKAIVELLAAECERDEGQRRDLLGKINKLAAEKGIVPRAVAQDCDGKDGSDF